MIREISSINIQNTNNLLIPKEGGKALGLILNFLDANPGDTFKWDSTALTQQNRISCIQTLWIDLSNSDAPLQVMIGTTGQMIVAKPRTQGYYPVLAPNPVVLVFSCAAAVLVPIQLLNSPIPGFAYDTQ